MLKYCEFIKGSGASYKKIYFSNLKNRQPEIMSGNRNNGDIALSVFRISLTPSLIFHPMTHEYAHSCKDREQRLDRVVVKDIKTTV